MSYELAFLDQALKEWRRLDSTTRDEFKAMLTQRLDHAKIPSSRLHGGKERYKIKLRSAGYRLVYEVRDRELLVLVVAVANANAMRSTRPPPGAAPIETPAPSISPRPSV
jgi:mRNA interferase RelE/StbE